MIRILVLLRYRIRLIDLLFYFNIPVAQSMASSREINISKFTFAKEEVSEAKAESVAHESIPLPSPPLEVRSEKVSGLSLKSIRAKKEILARKSEVNANTVEEKNEEFTENQLQAGWDEYIHRLKHKGSKILASIMETDMPKLKGKVIEVTLPNETMKNDLEKGQHQLMSFLKKKLQNTFISLEITVNEQAVKKYAYSNIEKFNKLKEKNPLIEKLRTTFDLDV